MKNKTIRDEIGRFTTRKVSFVDKYILNNRNLSVLLLSYIITLIFVYMTETTTVHAEIPPCPAEACEIIYQKATSTPVVEEKKVQSEIINYKGFNINRAHLQKVVDIFGKDPKIIAIIIAESGFNSSLIGYNCYYATGKGEYNKHLKVKIDYSNVSKTRRAGDVGWACKKEHRQYAFSHDIGIMMLNTSNGAKMGDLDHNLRVAKKLLDTNGYSAWSAYALGMTEQYMDDAYEILTYAK